MPNDGAQVTVFSLGGTIASTKNEADAIGGVTPQLGARELVNAVPQLGAIASIEAVAFRESASGDLSFPDLTELAREISARFDAGACGVVVTQGTDAIEETAFILDLLIRAPNAVVVTGAMRNPSIAGFDGPANLLAAVQVAVSSQARGLGTVVVMNDQIHAARFVRKTHTSNPATFQSPNAGALGWIVEGRPRIVIRPSTLRGLASVDGEGAPPVLLLRCAFDDDLRVISQVEGLGYEGVVIEGFGGGHVSARVVPSLERLATKMPVVLASRTGSGDVLQETYGFIGSERDLLSRGLIPAGFLDGLKARIVLSLLLTRDRQPTEVRRAFQELNDSLCQFDV